jgi:hypothetical protein
VVLQSFLQAGSERRFSTKFPRSGIRSLRRSPPQSHPIKIWSPLKPSRPRKRWLSPRPSDSYDRTTDHLRYQATRAGSGGRDPLVVLLWALGPPTLLRWLSQGNRTAAGEIRSRREEDRVVVPVQAHRQSATLRRLSQELAEAGITAKTWRCELSCGSMPATPSRIFGHCFDKPACRDYPRPCDR